jgi:hypothetical protein
MRHPAGSVPFTRTTVHPRLRGGGRPPARPSAALAGAWLWLALTGCAGGSGPAADGTGLSYDYWLPRAQYALKAQYVLLGCEAKPLSEPVRLKKQDGSEEEERFAPELNVRYTLQVQESFIADPNQHHSLSPFELASWTQDRNVKLVRHDNGTLKTVNSVAKDQTGAIIANVLAGVAKTIAVGALIGAEPVRDDELRRATARLCGREGLLALAEAARLKGEIASVRAALARRPLARDSAARYEAAQKKIAANQEALAAVTESRLTVAAEPDERRRPYDPKSREWADVQFPFAPADGAVKKAFLTPRGYEVASVVAGRVIETEKEKADRRALGQEAEPVDPLQVHVFLQVAGSSPPADGVPARDRPAILLRPPPLTDLLFCRLWCFLEGRQPERSTATDGFPEVATKHVISRHPAQPSQLGPVVALPLTTGIFSSRTISLEMAASGQYRELAFESAARGTAASAAFKDAATQGEEIAKQVRLHDDDAARLASLKAEHDRLKLEKDIRDLRRARAGEDGPADAP